MSDEQKPINRKPTSKEALTPEQVEQFEKIQLLKKNAQRNKEIQYRTKLLGIYLEAAAQKDMISRQWENYISIFRGRQWPARRPKYKVSAVMNFMVENIERKTALLTDAKPIPSIKPYKDHLQDTADILNELIRVIFQSSDYGQANSEMLENSQVFGSGFMGTLYDRTLRNGKGDIRVTSFDPRAVYFDPLVLKSYLLHEGEFVILEDIWPIEKARDVFPKRADLYKPDVGLSRFEPNQGPGLTRALVSKVLKSREDNLVTSEVPRVHVREYFIKDRSRTENDKLEFKNGLRKSVMVGDVIASDGESPYDDGMFPIDMLGWHTDFNSAWGWGDVELLSSPQELVNKITAIVTENMMLSSNAIWIGDHDALSKEDWKKLNNAPGSYVKKKPGRELRREPGIPFPEYILKFLEWTTSTKDVLSGMVDVMRGVRTGQVSSGVAVESLQLMAQALIRLRSRSHEALQARVGRKLISRIFQFYEPEKIIELLKMNQTEEQYTTYNSELLKPINKRGRQWLNDFMFMIEPGSSLGMAKTQRRQESMRLREMESIDDKALLDDLEYPHRDKVLKRVEEKRQDAMNQEVQAQAGDRGSRFPQQQGASPAGRG